MIRKELKAITLLRFVAAFYVFIFHINVRIPIDFGKYINKVIGNGATGMSLFFILSGFVLTYNYFNGIPKNYYRKRIARIYPTYIFMGIICLPFLFLSSYKVKTIISSFVIFIVPVQAWFYQAFPIWHFGGSWSISVELFFYAMFPILLKYMTNNNKIYFLILSYIASSVIIPLSMCFSKGIIFPVYYATPIYRLPEFIFGMAVGYYFVSGVKVRKSIFILSVISLFFILRMSNKGFMGVNYLILPVIGITLIFLGNIEFKKITSIITKPFIYLGEISYSFYLMQIFIMLALDAKIIPAFESSIVIWIILFVLNVALSMLSYHFIEKNKFIHNIVLKS